MSQKEKFAFYLSPEKKAILERRYQEDGSRSMTAFIERAESVQNVKKTNGCVSLEQRVRETWEEDDEWQD